MASWGSSLPNVSRSCFCLCYHGGGGCKQCPVPPSPMNSNSSLSLSGYSRISKQVSYSLVSLQTTIFLFLFFCVLGWSHFSCGPLSDIPPYSGCCIKCGVPIITVSLFFLLFSMCPSILCYIWAVKTALYFSSEENCSLYMYMFSIYMYICSLSMYSVCLCEEVNSVLSCATILDPSLSNIILKGPRIYIMVNEQWLLT